MDGGEMGELGRVSFVAICRVVRPYTGRDGGVLCGQGDVTWIPIPDASPWPAARPFRRRECQPG